MSHDYDVISASKARIEHLGNASALCPAGSSPSSGQLRDYGRGLTGAMSHLIRDLLISQFFRDLPIAGYYWQFMVCEQCTGQKASSSLKLCGSRGSCSDELDGYMGSNEFRLDELQICSEQLRSL